MNHLNSKDCELKIYGSAVNGLYMSGSDLDMTLIVSRKKSKNGIEFLRSLG